MAKADREDLHAMWELMPPEVQFALKGAVESLAQEMECGEPAVIRRCPRCGGNRTADCHEVDGIGDATVGLCVVCGYVWCLECNAHLISTVACDHWKICANCGNRMDETGNCGTVTWECTHIKEWLKRKIPTA